MPSKRLSQNLFFSACGLLFFVACGDENVSESPSSDELPITESYKDINDAPACTDDISNSLVTIGSSYYACIAENWEKMDIIVKGVCNIMPCNDDNNGTWVYSHSDMKPYQCNSGAWKDPEGRFFDEEKFIACYMDALVHDTLSSKDSLKNCTANKDGQIVVADEEMLFCQSGKWATVTGNVISEGDLPTCTKNGYTFIMNKMTLYQCKDGEWFNKGELITPASSETKQPESSSQQPESSSQQPVSSSQQPESSSQKAVSSSSSAPTVKSSSSISVSSSSSKTVDDGVTVRGLCTVSTKTAEKNEPML